MNSINLLVNRDNYVYTKTKMKYNNSFYYFNYSQNHELINPPRMTYS